MLGKIFTWLKMLSMTGNAGNVCGSCDNSCLTAFRIWCPLQVGRLISTGWHPSSHWPQSRELCLPVLSFNIPGNIAITGNASNACSFKNATFWQKIMLHDLMLQCHVVLSAFMTILMMKSVSATKCPPMRSQGLFYNKKRSDAGMALSGEVNKAAAGTRQTAVVAVRGRVWA